GRLLFAGAEQEVVLLLGVRADDDGADGATCDIAVRELDAAGCLDAAAANGHTPAAAPVGMDLDHAREKWTRYFLSPGELELVRALERSPAFATLGEHAEVDVGVVTGRNECFVLDQPGGNAAGRRGPAL